MKKRIRPKEGKKEKMERPAWGWNPWVAKPHEIRAHNNDVVNVVAGDCCVDVVTK